MARWMSRGLVSLRITMIVLGTLLAALLALPLVGVGGAAAAATPAESRAMPIHGAQREPARPSWTLSAGIPTHGRTANGCAITPAQAAGERLVLRLLNGHRAAARVKPLTLNPRLSLASREHSCEMLHTQKLRHESADGSSPFDWFTRHGVTYTTAGENLGSSGGYGLSAGIDVVDSGMMAEPNAEGTHHWNIVHAAYTGVGIGVIYVKGQLWLTEDFVG